MTTQGPCDGAPPLLQRARAGERGAFDELFEKFRNSVESVIRASIRPGYRQRLEVETILQDTFVRAFQSIESFQGDEEDLFHHWLRGVARKTVLRAEGELKPRPLDPAKLSPKSGPTASRLLRRHERFDRLQGALDELSPDARQIVYLSRIKGLNLREVAEEIGRPYEAVKKIFWRALRQLRGNLRETESLHLPDKPLDLGERDRE